MEVEQGKFYKIQKNGRILVGKCLKATPKKSKFEIVFDEVDMLKGKSQWYKESDLETISKIRDGNIVLEMFK